MWDFMTIELQILQFALDKQKATYEHKRIYSKLNSLFSYFVMKTHISTEAIKMIMSRGEQLSWHQLNSMYVLRRNTTSLFFLQIACFYFMPKWIYQCCKKLTRFRVYLPRKYHLTCYWKSSTCWRTLGHHQIGANWSFLCSIANYLQYQTVHCVHFLSELYKDKSQSVQSVMYGC